MGLKDYKFEIAISALVLVMIAGLGYVGKSPSVRKALANSELTFEMVRAKGFIASLFNLGDREISRTYVNPFDKKSKEDPPANRDTKKAALPAPKKTPTVAARKEEKKTEEPAKKPGVEVNIVQDSPHEGIGGDGVRAGERGPRANNAGTSTNTAANEDTTDTTAMSANQWRALISANPTKDNVDKMVAAYKAGSLDASSFYTIVADLLKNNKTETQSLGVYALSSSGYKAQSFAVAAEYYDSLGTEAKTSAHTYLMNYATKGYLAILQGSLQSTNAAVVELAAQVVVQGYQAAKSGTVTSSPRASRGDEVASSTSGYTKFISIFTSLAQSSDSTIAAIASSALSTLQS